ncbi:glucokinase [Paenibacillus sp. UNCCL117]|uniref:ROK family protein n=1 Tax=unclassified Paenibacillus TaxID=185978 RepID=UPI00088D3A88|nr:MULTISPECIES: ROK family protein [unclassified Paenibacillus]SDC18687.1 glucokinase [Paenibacillus sp. cl123]SFW18256.1 glucokinase [Paenibacillus sp. UNCCL117]
MKHYAGVDIGGTNMVIGIVDETGKTRKMVKIATQVQRGGEDVVARLAEAIERVKQEAQVEIEGVGIGVPGFVDHVKGTSVFAANLGWRDFPLADLLSARIGGLPVFVNNDVRMYVYGEATGGAGRGFNHVLGITVGTGMAAAMFNEGRLYYGSGGRAGELGHIALEGIDYVCNCGLTGCLETVASATGIARQAREAVERGESTVLAEKFPGEKAANITAADVSRAYDAGDPAAIAVLNRTGTLLGRGLATAITLFSPDLIVVGGGAAQAGERLLKPMREEMERAALSFYWKDLHIKPAELLEDAGVVGSALYAKGRLEAGVIL